MGSKRRWVMIAAAAAVLMLVGAACGGGDDGGGSGETGGGNLTGTIVISGSSTVQPISNLVAELFNETNPDVAISVDGPGTGDGFALFCQGEVDIADASRAIEDEEVAACSDAGIEYVELAIAYDGITVMTNPANGAVSCLNEGDLYALFGPQSEGIDTWDGADDLANQVGGTDNFPSASLDITAPGPESGTYDAFIELAGIEDTAIAQGVPEDDAAVLRKDYQSSPDDNVIITAVAGSPSALGFVGFAYAESAGEQIKEIEIDGDSGCVEPSRESIADGSYPLSRTLYIYVDGAKTAENAALSAFVDFYLSDDGIVASVQEAGYVDLPQDAIDQTRSTWDGAQA